MQRLKTILTNSLLAFAFISMGFALGKHAHSPEQQHAHLPLEKVNQVAVYYLHGTFRCVTCNSIERMTHDLLETRYAKQIQDGEIQWIKADFQENETLAEQFKVIASCVVVAQIHKGEIVSFQRLDEVWTLMQDQTAFDNYISQAIDSSLNAMGEDT